MTMNKKMLLFDLRELMGDYFYGDEKDDLILTVTEMKMRQNRQERIDDIIISFVNDITKNGTIEN